VFLLVLCLFSVMLVVCVLAFAVGNVLCLF